MKKTELNKGEREIAKWRENAERLQREGLYDPADEHDAW
jgi:hypothetical protein